MLHYNLVLVFIPFFCRITGPVVANVSRRRSSESSPADNNADDPSKNTHAVSNLVNMLWYVKISRQSTCTRRQICFLFPTLLVHISVLGGITTAQISASTWGPEGLARVWYTGSGSFDNTINCALVVAIIDDWAVAVASNQHRF